MITLILSSVCAYAGINDGLVAYYPFNGNANDESGNGHNGTVNGATLTTDVNGKPNSAFYFDSDWIAIPNNPDFIMSSFSIAAWVKWTGGPMDYGNAIVGNYSGDGSPQQQHYGLRMYSTSPGNGFFYYDDASEFDYVQSNLTFNDGGWHFVVGVLSAGASAKIYIDGVLDGIDTSSIPTKIIPAEDLYIGSEIQSVQGDGYPWRGSIDEVRLYNRALSADEIQELYSLHVHKIQIMMEFQIIRTTVLMFTILTRPILITMALVMPVIIIT